jgi:hypothetical protein
VSSTLSFAHPPSTLDSSFSVSLAPNKLDPPIYDYTRPMELAPAQPSAGTDDLPRPAWSSTPRPTVITSLSTHLPPSTTDHGSFPSSSLSPQSYSSPWLQSPDLTYSDLVAPHQVRIRTVRTFQSLIPCIAHLCIVFTSCSQLGECRFFTLESRIVCPSLHCGRSRRHRGSFKRLTTRFHITSAHATAPIPSGRRS